MKTVDLNRGVRHGARLIADFPIRVPHPNRELRRALAKQAKERAPGSAPLKPQVISKTIDTKEL